MGGAEVGGEWGGGYAGVLGGAVAVVEPHVRALSAAARLVHPQHRHRPRRRRRLDTNRPGLRAVGAGLRCSKQQGELPGITSACQSRVRKASCVAGSQPPMANVSTRPLRDSEYDIIPLSIA